jgi:hypothetical protein
MPLKRKIAEVQSTTVSVRQEDIASDDSSSTASSESSNDQIKSSSNIVALLNNQSASTLVTDIHSNVRQKKRNINRSVPIVDVVHDPENYTKREFAKMKRDWWQVNVELRKDTTHHFPCKFESRIPKKGESEPGSDFRKQCKICKRTKTNFFCRRCGVALCIRGLDDKCCWEIFHTYESFDQPAQPEV